MKNFTITLTKNELYHMAESLKLASDMARQVGIPELVNKLNAVALQILKQVSEADANRN